MKKSQYIQLVLVAAVLSCCDNRKEPVRNVYMRSDSTAQYSHTRGVHGGHYAFIPYGMFLASGYSRAGYFSSSLNERSNVGTNPMKSNIVRGGFGKSAFHVSS